MLFHIIRFYDDFYADNYDFLPRLGFKEFTREIFNHCPLFSGMKNNVDKILEYYRMYKSKIKVCGCVILNHDMSKILLVCSWGNTSWSLPRGKLNENESDIDCAIRETYEETGYDVSSKMIYDGSNVIESSTGSKAITLYIVPNVNENIVFKPLSRKEISDIKFFPLNQIPNDSFAVKEFLRPIKLWISKYKLLYSKENKQMKKSKSVSVSSKLKMKKRIMENESESFTKRNPDTFLGDEANSWSVNAMFEANSSLTGRKYDYDGSSNSFGSLHPRYVNYNDNKNIDESEIIKRRKSSLGEEIDLDLLSLKSKEFHSLRPKSGNDNRDGIAISSKIAKLANTSNQFLPFLLPTPFKFNKDLIMKSVDSKLSI